MKKMLLLSAVSALVLGVGIQSDRAEAARTVPGLEHATESSGKDMYWTAGLGLALVPDFEGSKDTKAALFPVAGVVATNGMSVDLMGNVIKANVIPSKTIQFGPLLRYRGERKNVKNDRVDSMADIDAAVELGAYAGFLMNEWSFKLDLTHDTSGVHNGTLLGASLGYSWNANPVKLTLTGFTTCADSNYIDTYFGVNSANRGGSGFAAWSPGGGVKDVGSSLSARYGIDSHWNITGALRYSRLLGDAADSPIVKDEGSPNQIVLGVAATYTY